MGRTLVLVLEADPFLRAPLADQLTKHGHDVLCAGSAEEALTALSHRSVYVLVVGHHPLSRLIPEFLPLAAEKAPCVATVVLSSVPSVEDGIEAMKLGAVDFLVHPCLPDVLESALARAVCIARTRRSIAAREQRRDLLVGSSGALKKVRDTIACLAGSDATTVLIEGETGTGKELVAQAIQACSARRSRPYLRLNCAALPEALFESELFGHEKGAFTTAHAQRPGMFEAASGGTVLLDEMGDLPQSAQAKLLRFLENKTYRRIGGLEERTANVRIIAATHVDLEAQIAAGRFRSDLFFRLNVIRVRLPPLRERPEDVVALAAAFLGDFNERFGRGVGGIAVEAFEALEHYTWPGNVRELRNVLERAFILYPRMEELRREHLPRHITEDVRRKLGTQRGPRDLALHATERRLLSEAILRAGGNQTHAARMLGITRFTLRYRLRKHGLRSRPIGAGPAIDALA